MTSASFRTGGQSILWSEAARSQPVIQCLVKNRLPRTIGDKGYESKLLSGILRHPEGERPCRLGGLGILDVVAGLLRADGANLSGSSIGARGIPRHVEPNKFWTPWLTATMFANALVWPA